MHEHTALVVETRVLTPVVRHVVLEVEQPEDFRFTAGQFLQFTLGPRILRHFSIASAPYELPRVDLCADISPGGHGSRFIESLRCGQRITLGGPFGVFVVPPTEQRPLEFVAAGAGIAPTRAMIRALVKTPRPPQSFTLTFGNRIEADILYHAEWEALASSSPVFRYLPTLSQPSERWAGARGRVTDLLPTRASELPGRVFFLCGSPQMVDDTRKTLAEAGVPEASVHFEKFT